MKTIRLLLLIALVVVSCSENKDSSAKLLKLVDRNLDMAIEQYMQMAESLIDKPGLLPRSYSGGNLITCHSEWWVSGFFPGSLWYLYEYSDNEKIKKMAELFSKRVEDQQFTTDNHDVGFMIYNSFGNGYRITGDNQYKDVILTAAGSLATRFNPVVGCIRSWDWGEWQFPVIIDNMMNLELLFFASQEEGNRYMYDLAVSHADKTLTNHFRPDGSCFHVVSYDTVTGNVLSRETRQGYSDESAWARGQAWALYGYTMCYRETKNVAYLNQAKKTAGFIINHPNFPEDKIPYWDFDDPEIPDTYRDASSAAIICSALTELSRYVDRPLRDKYLTIAEILIRSLSSRAYRSSPGTNGNFLLKHGVGSKPENSEVDVPLTYADYYYIEAMMRYKKLKDNLNIEHRLTNVD